MGGFHGLKLAILLAVILGAAWYELRTSVLQARLFSWYASDVSFRVGPGESPAIAFPKDGPFDRFHGHVQLPDFVKRLAGAGYLVTEQARASSRLMGLMKRGIHPPYPELGATRLRIRAQDGQILYSSNSGGRIFHTFDEVPPVIVKTVLFLENRELDPAGDSAVNPAIEWDRLGWAGLMYVGRLAGLSFPVEGGSTLAVQLEKYLVLEYLNTIPLAA